MSTQDRRMFARVREDGLLAAGSSPWSCCSRAGATRPACSTSRCASPVRSAVTALHVNYGIRESADEDERHCHELCASLGVALEVRRPARPREREPAGVGARGALPRGARAGRRRRRGRRPYADRPGRDDPLPAGVLAEPAGAARDAARARARWSGRCSAFTREETAAYCVERGLRVARGRDQRVATRTPATGSAPGWCRRCGASTRRPRTTCSRWRRSSATRARCSTRSSTRCWGRRPSRSPRCARCPPRCAGSWSSAWPTRPPAASPRARRGRADEIAALSDRGTAMLDIGNGLRAVAEYGVLRFEPLGGPSRVAARAGRAGDPGQRRRSVGCEVRCELAEPALEPGVLDRAALGTELLVRSWRPGDRIAPLGLGGTKRLQDLFTAAARAAAASAPACRSSSRAARSPGWPGVATVRAVQGDRRRRARRSGSAADCR